jgi:hypothetical protein
LESRMSNPQENARPVEEKPSFFGLPVRLRYVRSVMFWGGFLNGLGLGIFLAVILVVLEVIKLDRDQWNHWVSVLVLVPIFIGQEIAQRAARARSRQQQEKGTCKTNEAEPAAAPDPERIGSK